MPTSRLLTPAADLEPIATDMRTTPEESSSIHMTFAFAPWRATHFASASARRAVSVTRALPVADDACSTQMPSLVTATVTSLVTPRSSFPSLRLASALVTESLSIAFALAASLPDAFAEDEPESALPVESGADLPAPATEPVAKARGSLPCTYWLMDQAQNATSAAASTATVTRAAPIPCLGPCPGPPSARAPVSCWPASCERRPLVASALPLASAAVLADL